MLKAVLPSPAERDVSLEYDPSFHVTTWLRFERFAFERVISASVPASTVVSVRDAVLGSYAAASSYSTTSVALLLLKSKALTEELTPFTVAVMLALETDRMSEEKELQFTSRNSPEVFLKPSVVK